MLPDAGYSDSPKECLQTVVLLELSWLRLWMRCGEQLSEACHLSPLPRTVWAPQEVTHTSGSLSVRPKLTIPQFWGTVVNLLTQSMASPSSRMEACF